MASATKGRDRADAVLAVLIVGLVATSGASGQSVSIARWRGDATGAYSMVMDDYGECFFGWIPVIDSMLSNRDLNVSFALVGNRTCINWPRTRAWVAKGHEFVNHSWDHLMDPNLPTDQYAQQFDSCSALVNRMLPDQDCLFMCFSGDQRQTPKIEYLRTRRFIGARGGQYRSTNPWSLPDPFLCNFLCYNTSEGVAGLNKSVDDAISEGGWALRETHNVADFHYMPISPEIFASHLSYCRLRIDNGELWMAPVQHVVKYAMERNSFQASITSQTATALEIGFVTNAAEINPSPLVDNTVYDYPLTLLVALNGFAAAEVLQSGASIPFKVREDTLQFDAAPYGGPVTVSTTVSVRPLVGSASASQWVRVASGRQPRLVVAREGGYTVEVYGLSGMLLERLDVDGAGQHELLPRDARGTWMVKVRLRHERETVVLPVVAR